MRGQPNGPRMMLKRVATFMKDTCRLYLRRQDVFECLPAIARSFNRRGVVVTAGRHCRVTPRASIDSSKASRYMIMIMIIIVMFHRRILQVLLKVVDP